jgi:hypothetical protein
MSFETEIVDRYGSIINEVMRSMLSIVSEGGDVNEDENINKVQVMSGSIMLEYKYRLEASFTELQRVQPDFLRRISVNETMKAQRKRYLSAIQEREIKRSELLRKVRGLRKQVPEGLRSQLLKELTG